MKSQLSFKSKTEDPIEAACPEYSQVGQLSLQTQLQDPAGCIPTTHQQAVNLCCLCFQRLRSVQATAQLHRVEVTQGVLLGGTVTNLAAWKRHSRDAQSTYYVTNCCWGFFWLRKQCTQNCGQNTLFRLQSQRFKMWKCQKWGCSHTLILPPGALVTQLFTQAHTFLQDSHLTPCWIRSISTACVMRATVLSMIFLTVMENIFSGLQEEKIWCPNEELIILKNTCTPKKQQPNNNETRNPVTTQFWRVLLLQNSFILANCTDIPFRTHYPGWSLPDLHKQLSLRGTRHGKSQLQLKAQKHKTCGSHISDD